jgi:hypothetical protein
MKAMETKYYLLGLRPVYFDKTEDGSITNPQAFNRKTKKFEYDYDCWINIIFGKYDDLRELSKDEFWEYVESLKNENGN